MTLADEAVFAELDRLGKEIIEEAVHRHVGKPDRLDEATAVYFDFFTKVLTKALTGKES